MVNSYLSLILPYAAFSLPMAILICTGFMNDIPHELDEAACIDGCGLWKTFFYVIIPLMKPALSTITIYSFLQCWNELMFANVFISKDSLKTLPVGIQALSGQHTTDWGPIGAALVIATFPTLIAYVFLSKKIQESFIAGAVKG
jgi:raffinose/stachyose/melibiose transport system permease protein